MSQPTHIIKTFFVISFLMLVACVDHDSDQYQGYIEGEYTYVTAHANGILKELLVARGDYVKKNDRLFILEPQPESDLVVEAKERIAQATAQLAEAQASLDLSVLTLKRTEALYRKKAVDRASLDNATASFNRDQARVRNARANLLAAKALFSRFKWSSLQKTVVSPKDALVFDTYNKTGELVTGGQPVLSLLAPHDIKVVFFVPEPLLNRISIGSTIVITCRTCQRDFHSKVNFISPRVEYTPPVIYSTETTSKLVFRAEGFIDPKDTKALHPGQPVKVKVVSF